MLIIERLKKHDRNNLEIKYTFPIPDDRNNVEYEVEMYLFVPETIGINKETYTDKQFYYDERNHIRLKTPQFLLKNIVKGPDSPLEKLKISMESMIAESYSGNTVENCLRHIKIYCYVMKSALRDGSAFIITQSEPEERTKLIAEAVDCTKNILQSFRDAGQILRIPGMENRVSEIFSWADEYNSMLAKKYMVQLLRYAGKYAEDATGPLVSLLEEEVAYRQRRGFPVATEGQSNEELLYRMSALKKLMGQVLYIKTLTREEGRFIGHAIPGIAAGIAMSFATLMLYFTRTNINELTATLFLLIVGTYILKDRLKEWSKSLFAQYAGKLLYDFKTLLLTNSGKKIGWRRETFQFIKFDDLPEDIAKLRRHITNCGLERIRLIEHILHTRRRIRLHSKDCRKMLDDFQVDGINDIVRFNLRSFFSGMDNPDKKLYILKDGVAKQITGRRVYHLNMILRFSSDQVNELRRFRLVVSRDGIQRIEEIL